MHLHTFYPTIFSMLSLSFAHPTFPLPVSLVHDFPNGTWIENLAVRSNGHILATQDGAPKLYQINPFSAETNNSILLHEFNNTASVLGITEGAPDIFYIATANFSSKTGNGYGEDYIYRLDFNVETLEIDVIAAVPTSGALDGLTYLGGELDLLLATDAFSGVIWSISIMTGDVAIAINSTYTRATQGFAVNGARVRGEELYFTNTAQQTLVKVPVNEKGGANGPYTVLAQGGFVPDDFALDAGEDAYVASYTNGSNGVVFVPREGGEATYIAGMAGPTACAFGRTANDSDVLYVSTSGGDYAYLTEDPVRVSGKIVRIDVGRRGQV